MSNKDRNITVEVGNINIKTPSNVLADNVGIQGSIRIGPDSGLPNTKVRPIRINNPVMIEDGNKIRFAGTGNVERWALSTDSNVNLAFDYHSGSTNNDDADSSTDVLSKFILDGDEENTDTNVNRADGQPAADSGEAPQGGALILCDEDGIGRFKFWVYKDSNDDWSLQVSKNSNATGTASWASFHQIGG